MRSINEVLKFLCCDSFANFPDAEGRAFRTNRTKCMVIKARFQVLGDCLIPATTWSHRGLSCIPPLLRFARSELVLNVKEPGCHEGVGV